MSQQNALVCLSKAARSFLNGAVATLQIYVFYRAISYRDPAWIPLTLSCILLANTIKSFIFTRLAKYLGDFNIVALGCLMYFFPFVISNHGELSKYGGALAFIRFFALGFYPIDGEEIAIFESI